MDPAELERRVIRLGWWNLLWVTLSIVGGLALGFVWLGTYVRSEIHQVRCTPSGDGLRLSVSDDGPFVVTHLVYSAHKATAALPEPVAIIDSHGGEISKETIAKLKWTDILGQESDPPKLDDIQALYIDVRTTKKRETKAD
ncbi:MAG: hypothetical protein JSS65_04335 [Armatimonadetes bacterium]|nr:hypothetical protein [Armatimonadota bacterium]